MDIIKEIQTIEPVDGESTVTTVTAWGEIIYTGGVTDILVHQLRNLPDEGFTTNQTETKENEMNTTTIIETIKPTTTKETIMETQVTQADVVIETPVLKEKPSQEDMLKTLASEISPNELALLVESFKPLVQGFIQSWMNTPADQKKALGENLINKITGTANVATAKATASQVVVPTTRTVDPVDAISKLALSW